MTNEKSRAEDKSYFFQDLANHWALESVQELVKRKIIHSDQDDLFHPDLNITTEQFIVWIVKTCHAGVEENASSQLHFAMETGLIEDYDLVSREKSIERRQVARIVHDTLRIKFNEKDEDDWSAAKDLLDLYSCRTCVQHISQIYLKGIIEPEQPNLFNVTGPMSRAEAASVILKMLDQSRRAPKSVVTRHEIIALTPEEAREFLTKNHLTLLLDVRTGADYLGGHLSGSLSLPLESIHADPESVSSNKDTPIMLYCQMGYRSRLAAELLVEAGYKHVYTIPGVGEHQYDLIE